MDHNVTREIGKKLYLKEVMGVVLNIILSFVFFIHMFTILSIVKILYGRMEDIKTTYSYVKYFLFEILLLNTSVVVSFMYIDNLLISLGVIVSVMIIVTLIIIQRKRLLTSTMDKFLNFFEIWNFGVNEKTGLEWEIKETDTTIYLIDTQTKKACAQESSLFDGFKKYNQSYKREKFIDFIL